MSLFEVGHDLGEVVDGEGGDGEEDHGGRGAHESTLRGALVEVGLDRKDKPDPETGTVGDHEADSSEDEGDKSCNVGIVVLDALDFWLVFDDTVWPPGVCRQCC